MNILILDAHTIESLSVFKSLKKNNHWILALCDNMLSYGYQSRYPDKKIIKPKLLYKSEEFLNYIISIVKDYRVDVIMPMYDLSAEFLSFYKDQLLEYVLFIAPDYKVFVNGYNKGMLMESCRINNIPHPRTAKLNIENIDIISNYVGFPAIIKPDITSGGRGMKIVDNIYQVKDQYFKIYKQFGDCSLQEYIPFGGKQYKVQMFRYGEQKIINPVVVEKIRFYPEKGGSSCMNKTIFNNDLVGIAEKVLSVINWYGFADFDMIQDPRTGDVKVMEINPRFPASIKSAYISGVDYADIYLRLCYKQAINDYEYKYGKYLRYFALDLLWFINSKNRLSTNPSWFRLFDKNIYYQDGSWDDPLPFILGNIGNLLKMKNKSFRESKKA